MNRSRFFVALIVMMTATFLMLGPSAAFAETTGPTIASDKPDYVPGDTVVLTGAGWEPGERVNIFVNDDDRQSWSHSADVTADEGGNVRDSFELPTWFVALYTASATGATSGSTTTTFTDGALQVVGASSTTGAFTFTVRLTGYSDAACTSNAGTPTDATFSTTTGAVGNSVKDGNGNNASSFKLHVVGTSSDGRTFLGWESSSTTADICGAVPAQASVTKTAHFGAPPPSDTTPPVISYVLNPASPDGSNGWYKSSVTLAWTVTDSESAVTKTGCVDQNIAADQNATTYSCSASSAGGSAGPVDVMIKRDATAPDTNITAGPSDPSGNASPSFSFNGSDSTSSVASFQCWLDSDPWYACSSPKALSGLSGGPHTFKVRATDTAGNTDQSPDSFTWTVDLAAPDINCTVPDTSIWYDANVTVPCAASDSSGLANVDDATFDLTASLGAGNESPSVATGTKTVCDTLGNCVTAGPYTFKIDKKAPVVTCGTADSVWHATDQSVACTATDGGSGLADSADASFSLSTDVEADTETASAYTGSKVVKDAVGNAAAQVGPFSFMIDKKAPTITDTGPTPTSPNGTSPWYITAVTNGFSASDLGSGLSAVCDLVFPKSVSTGTNEGTAVSVSSGSCADAVGNTNTGIGSASFHIDLTDPSVSITSPADGITTILGSVTVSGTASDTPSGLASLTVNGTPTVASGGEWSTNVTLTCGANTITALATDNAGRTKSASITLTKLCFTLQYQQPIDQSTSTPIVNTGKYGRVIPVKVLLYLDGVAQGDIALANRGLTLQMGVNGASCSGGIATDAVEAYADAGASAAGTNLFRWDSVAKQWIYNLDTKTPPGVAMAINSCYRLDVYVNDGTNKVKISTSPYALFKPTK